MNKRSRFLYLVVVFVFSMALFGVMPALATPPDRFTIQNSGSTILTQCDGFNVISDWTSTETFTYYYNQQGDLETITVHINGRDRVYNSETGFEVFGNFAANTTFDVATSQSFQRGLAYNISVPGYGIVYQVSGMVRIVFVEGVPVVVKSAGNIQLNTGLLCEAMDQ
jgi:hypothetical protein